MSDLKASCETTQQSDFDSIINRLRSNISSTEDFANIIFKKVLTIKDFREDCPCDPESGPMKEPETFTEIIYYQMKRLEKINQTLNEIKKGLEKIVG